MKKVFFGILLAMAGLVSILAVPLQIVLMNFVPTLHHLGAVITLVMYLATALGYWLLMSGSEELPQTQMWHYVGLFSKILCAYNVAMGLLVFVQNLGFFTLNLPTLVSQVLYYITDLGSFFIMYFCVLGVRELQYLSRKNLYAAQIQKCFSAWVLSTLTSESPSLTPEESRRLFDEVEADYADIPQRKERMKRLRQDPYYNALQIKYAYAVTCHKAQGGQWQRVFIDQGYVTPEMGDASYLRWLYTAYTRTTDRLYLVNWPEEQREVE